MEIALRPHLMSSQTVRREVRVGMTIQQMVDTIEDYDERVRQLNLCVLVNGEALPRDQWIVYQISGLERVEVAAVLHGGGGSKRILALVASIALSTFVGPAANFLMGVGASSTALLVAKAGILLIGSLAISAIFAPPKIDTGDTGKTSKAYTFGSQANAVRPFEVVPRIYGRHRVRPDIAGIPYTTNVGEDSYFHCLYCFGYGPLKLEDFRIGQNPLTNYKDYEIKVHEALTDPADLEIYKQDVWQDPLNTEVIQSTPVVVTTRPAIDVATIDLVFQQGLGYVNDGGGVDSRATDMTVQYRVHGTSGAWLPASGKVSHGSFGSSRSGTFTAPLVTEDYYETSGGAKQVYKIQEGVTGLDVQSWGGAVLAPGSVVKIAQYSMTIASSSAGRVDFTTAFPGQLTFSDDKVPFTNLTTGTGSDGVWHIEDAKRGGFIASIDLTFPSAGTWSVRVAKVEVDPDENDENYSRNLWQRNVVAVKSFKNAFPVQPEVPLCLVELKIKATGQLNGSVEEFSGIATAKLQVWNGSTWVIEETRNPAWAYLDALRGSSNRRSLPDSRVDLDAIKAWAVRCDTITSPFIQAMGTCDIVLDKEYTLWEVLQSIATTGRAAPTVKDNKYSVLIDDANRSPVQMFTPRNSSNLRSTRSYIDNPHALRLRWIDPDANFGPGEITVYATGYDENNATKFEDLQTFGMTRVEQVTRYGRYMMAQGRLRQERFSIDTGIENIVCVRGDMVLVAHDVIQVGGEACRINSISGNRLYFDAPPTLYSLSAGSAGVRIRKSTGLSTAVLDISAIHADGVTLSASVPGGVAVGDLLVFGEKTSVTGTYIVDYVRPNSSMGATIGLEEYAPAVYDAESTGIIPPYVPQGVNAYLLNPPVSLTTTLIEYTEEGSTPYGTVLAQWMGPTGVRTLPDFYRVFNVAPDGTEKVLGDSTGFSYKIGPLDLSQVGGRGYTVLVRAFYGASSSQPASSTITLPLRDTVPPKNVDSFAVIDLSSGFRRYEFDFTDGRVPEGVLGVEIRYTVGHVDPVVWAAMDQVVVGNGLTYFSQSGVEVSVPTGANVYTFAARTVDKFGVLAAEPLVIYKTLGASAVTTGDGDRDTTAPPTPTGLLVQPGIMQVTFQHDIPTYTMGNGHDRTNIYAKEMAPGDPLPTFGSATFFGSFQGSIGSLPAQPGTTYRFWAKWVTKNGVESATPAGGTNGVAATTGLDVSRLLDILENEITESQLYSALGARIDLVDGSGAGSVNARISVESGTRASETGTLFSRYTVKIDTNGYVTGFGLASTANDGVVVSSFAVRSDSFYIASPSGPGVVAPSMPFIVRTTPTYINGELVPVGVYMRDAYIQNGTITSAMIGYLSADKITTGYMSAARILAGTITADKVQVGALMSVDAGNRTYGADFPSSGAFNYTTATPTVLAFTPSSGKVNLSAMVEVQVQGANAAIDHVQVEVTTYIDSTPYSFGGVGYPIMRGGNSAVCIPVVGQITSLTSALHALHFTARAEPRDNTGANVVFGTGGFIGVFASAVVFENKV